MTDSTNDALARISATGVSVWLDDLSRDALQDGTLAELKQRMSRHELSLEELFLE